MKRKQFTFYRSFYEAVMKLPPEQQFPLLKSVIEYALDRFVSSELDPAQEAVFIVIKANLDAAWEKSRNGAAGGALGKRGEGEKISKGKNKEKRKEKIKDKTESKDNGFQQFWERYPMKLGMEAAMDEWGRVCQVKDQILAGLEDWRNCRQWALEGGRFIPRADKWLREHWWEQRPTGVIPKGGSGLLGKAELEAIDRLFEQGGTQ